MYIDTHCHLNFSDFDPDRAMVIGNAKKAGVKQIIVPGVDAGSSRSAMVLAQKHHGVIFASIGFHPYEASHVSINEALSFLTQYLPSTMNHEPKTINSLVAIGECGLDYHLFKGEEAAGKKQVQRELFQAHLELALAHDLPVIMHCRDAYEDFFTVLDSLPHTPRGVIHCFSGGLQELKMAQERKLFIGIDGNVTYSKLLWQIVPHVPLGHLLLETDTPYLTPIPHRGTRNEPKYIPLIAQKIAQLQGIHRDDVETSTTQNAVRLFQLP